MVTMVFDMAVVIDLVLQHGQSGDTELADARMCGILKLTAPDAAPQAAGFYSIFNSRIFYVLDYFIL